jgi:hypothetical protein
MVNIGMMDGWHGDEDECRGYCGLCDECLNLSEQKGDLDYEASRYNDDE